MKTVMCAGCECPILDRFLFKVEESAWHAKCVKCWDCQATLAEKCFSRDGKLFCRTDFFRRFGTKCGGCSQGICPTDLVRRARGRVFHVACFTCLLCRKQLATGEELYVLDETRFVCKEDYIASRQHHHQAPVSSSSPPLDSPPDFEDPLGDRSSSSPPAPGGTADYRDIVSGGSGANSPAGPPAEDAAAPADCLGGPEAQGPGTGDEGAAGGKRRGPRTTIKAKQLETLKAAFAATPKPTRHIREQLAQETGLNMRVIQVWFQNRRSKERRMKQLSTLGVRRHFFRNPRRAMRPIRAGMVDEAAVHGNAPTFASYFSDSNSPNEFGYGHHQGFYDYFPGSHPQGIVDFPGTVPLGSTMEGQQGQHPVALSNGVTSLGQEGPYVSNPPSDCLGAARSSPENSSAIPEGNGYPGRTFPYMGGHPLAPQHESRAWLASS